MPLKHSVEEIILKNGARGLLIDVPGTTSVFYDIHFWAGIRFVADQSRSQVAHIMEHLSFGANKKFPSPEAFSQEFSKNGAYHNASTSNVDMSYYTNAALMEWDRILDLHLLAITQPIYSQEALDAEKGNVREELAGYATKHSRILWQEVMKSARLNRWYDPVEIKTIKNVTLSDVSKHFELTHTTSNMMFIIAGNLKMHRAEIEEKLGAIKLKRGTPLQLPKETAQPSGPVFIQRSDLPTLTFMLTFFLNDRTLTRDELRTMDVLSHVLTDTFHSRIFGKARKRGICYGMGSGYVSSPTGLTEFNIGGQVTFENAPALFELMIEELNDIRAHGITEEELQQAKDYRLGSLQLSHETVESLAGWYGEEYYEEGRIDYMDEMPDRIAKTTVKDVQDMLNEFFMGNLWTLGGIGNSTAAEFAPFYEFFHNHISNKTIQ